MRSSPAAAPWQLADCATKSLSQQLCLLEEARLLGGSWDLVSLFKEQAGSEQPGLPSCVQLVFVLASHLPNT